MNATVNFNQSYVLPNIVGGKGSQAGGSQSLSSM